MKPNANNHNANPQYIRGLIDKIGLSQREIARTLGIPERTFRQYITALDNATYVQCPYTVQFALESWANLTPS